VAPTTYGRAFVGGAEVVKKERKEEKKENCESTSRTRPSFYSEETAIDAVMVEERFLMCT
jgi:hypothetical protein